MEIPKEWDSLDTGLIHLTFIIQCPYDFRGMSIYNIGKQYRLIIF